jgi:pilus assembly protein CpaB
VVSAVLFGAAAWVALSAFLPQPEARGVPVVVVAQDLMAGHVLGRDDLAVADWPLDLRPDGAVADPATLVGRALGAGMSRGEPLTAARFRGPGLLAGVESGLVAAHVRLADPAMAGMAGSGDHVDLISSTGKLVAANVVVLAVDSGPAAGGGWSATPESGRPGGVIVAVAGEAALRLAAVDPSGLSDSTFSLVMRPPSP